MKIIVIGCGSIGKRHAKNLNFLGIKDIVLCDPIQSKLISLGKIIRTSLLYKDFKEALRENPDISVAIICTPTAFHMEPAIYLAKRKINLFIEKPLSNNLKKTKLLSKIASSKKITVMMGHSYMFEDGFLKLKSLLDKNVIGKLYYATYFQGQYLPDWHPKEDYKIEYTASKSLGGGALLTLTSHTFYLIEWLFGRIKSIDGYLIGKIGSLEVDVDDSVFLLMKTERGVIVQTQNNFIVKVHNHKLIVEGIKGRLEFDFVEKKILLLLNNHKPKLVHTNKDNNERFLKEMKFFLKKLKQKNLEKNLNLESGIRFLQKIKPLQKKAFFIS